MSLTLTVNSTRWVVTLSKNSSLKAYCKGDKTNSYSGTSHTVTTGWGNAQRLLWRWLSAPPFQPTGIYPFPDFSYAQSGTSHSPGTLILPLKCLLEPFSCIPSHHPAQMRRLKIWISPGSSLLGFLLKASVVHDSSFSRLQSLTSSETFWGSTFAPFIRCKVFCLNCEALYHLLVSSYHILPSPPCPGSGLPKWGKFPPNSIVYHFPPVLYLSHVSKPPEIHTLLSKSYLPVFSKKLLLILQVP